MPSRSKPRIHSLTAPEVPDRLVSRPHIVETIKRYLGSDTDIVLLDGPSGSGRTTLLLDFIETIGEPCFALFLKAGNRASYSPSLVTQDLGSQLHSFLRPLSTPPETQWTNANVRSLWRKCNNKLIRLGSLGYVVIDGIHHIDPHESEIGEAIWALMPRHFAQLKILCSVNPDQYAIPSLHGAKVKPFPVQSFAPHESHYYLSDVVTDWKERERFHQRFLGHPASLASLRRQLQFLSNGLEDPLQFFPSDPKRLLENEWEVSRPSSPDDIRALATLVAAGRPLPNSSISENCGLSENDVAVAFEAIPFLAYSTKYAGWTFCCNGIRAVVSRILRTEIESARELLSRSYLTDPDSRQALSHLPQLLEYASQSENLLSWLTEDRIAELLRTHNTIASLEPTLAAAIAVTKEAQQYQGLLAYSISRSTIRYLSYTANLNDEIGARAALGDFDGAMKLVNSVPLQTRRLRLMAAVLDAFADERGIPLDSLRTEFEAMLNQMDWSSLSTDEAISIAEDVYPVDPAKGIDILNKVIGAEGGEGALDLTLARLSLSALKVNASDQLSKTADQRDPIPHYSLIDNKLRQFLDTAGKLLEAKSASDMLNATKSIREPSQKLFFLRKWSLNNALHKDALLITEHAIALSIKSTASVPTADFYREITTPLPYHLESDRIDDIIRMVDGQDNIIKERGPTEEYVRLHLQVVQSQWNRGEVKQAYNRMYKLYLGTIDTLKASATLLSCLSWCTSIASTLQGQRQVDDCEELFELIEEDFHTCLNAILQNSAEQLEIVRGALQALAVNVPDKACSVASRLNTGRRRTMAYRVILDAICRSESASLRFDTVNKILELLLTTEHYDSAVLQLITRLCSDVKDNKFSLEDITWVLRFVGNCQSAIITIRCTASLLAVTTKHRNCSSTNTRLERVLISTFDGLLSDTDKYEAACILLVTLKGQVNKCNEVVNHVLVFLQGLKGYRPLDRVTSNGLYCVLDLLAKSVRGLANSGNLGEKDVERVCSLISSIDNDALKLTLHASLALYLWSVDYTKMSTTVVNNHLWPILNGLTTTDLSTTYSMWEEVYPVLWLQNRDRAREGIEDFPEWVRERCNVALCYTILRRQPITDPFDDRARNRRIGRSYDDILNVLQVCKHSSSEDLIAKVLEWVADELTGKNPQHKLTGSQRAEVARRMFEIAKTNLPTASGIAHHGYRILCQAHALRVSKIEGCTMQNLVNQALKLENKADRVFVLAHLGIYTNHRKKRLDLMRLADKESGDLLTQEDRFGRYFTIASILAEKDRTLAKSVLKKAYEQIANGGYKDSGFQERNLIDLAYRLDPNLPMELAVVYDKDRVRKEYYENRAQKEVKSLNLKRDIVNNAIPLKNKANTHDEKSFASAVWRALGSLNSGMMPGVKPDKCREMIRRASESALHIAYPLYSWALASLEMAYAGEGARHRYLRETFEGVLRGAKLYCNLTEVTGALQEVPDWEDLSISDGSLMVDVGDQEKAWGFLDDWIRLRAEEYLVIVDPYFGTGHLELLRSVLKSDHEIAVFVITGLRNMNESIMDLADRLNDAWKQICDQAPPKTEITVVYDANAPQNPAPFHDRWLLSKGVGLCIGTSLNGLGNRLSSITQLSDKGLRSVNEKIEPYRKGTLNTLDGKKLMYSKFELAR